jgi:multidrug efflux pump subunit AcrB
MTETLPSTPPQHGFTNAVVRAFLHSNLSIVLIILAAAVGVAALMVTPREEDPQIVVPLADVYVDYPGRSAAEVEKLVATPLEKLLHEIDGVEYVYSMSREGQAIITVRFYVGEDRERSLVKLYKRIDEHVDVVPPGVTSWVVKPVEIDDVPIVTLTLRPRNDAAAAADEYTLRRVAEELAQRLAALPNLSRTYVVGGQPRAAMVYLDPSRMEAYGVSPVQVQRALSRSNLTQTAGEFARGDVGFRVEVRGAYASVAEVGESVVAVAGDRPVFLKDVATVIDGPAEEISYVRHAWGPGRGVDNHHGMTGTVIGGTVAASDDSADAASVPAVTIAVAKKRGANAVRVAESVLAETERLRAEVIPDDFDVVITRNYGLTANEKVNELVEALAVAVFIVIALLTLGLGWRESIIVAVAVPVVFGLTLAVNLALGFTINRVTLFALILSLGLLVDDPIVDVENITRHFAMRRRATRAIVMEAVAEIRPPLIAATMAVIVSFLPMFFITGMMGPYMRPMALNVPVTMLMSMLVAFTITPWLSYHLLRRRYTGEGLALQTHAVDVDDPAVIKASPLYRFFHPLMAPLLHSRAIAWSFLLGMGLLTALAAGLAATRHVPLKMLPFDNKNELLLVLDFDEGTTLQRSDAAVREMERYLQSVPEVTDVTAYVGMAAPMDFNGMVRHYYLRRGDHVADIRVNLVGKKSRGEKSHALGLRMRDDLTRIADAHGAALRIVETPPGPPVLAGVVAEVYGREDHAYDALLHAAGQVRTRLAQEPGVVDVDDVVEAAQQKLAFVVDREKAAISGVSVEDVAATLRACLGGVDAGTVQDQDERHPLRIVLQLPRAARSSTDDLARVTVAGAGGAMVPLAEIGRWESRRVDQTIYHKNLRRVVYVYAETAGRPPADVVVDVQADRGQDAVATPAARPVAGRTFLQSGGGLPWDVADGIRVDFAGEGEWKITLDVFRDLGLAFAAALAGIYVLLVAQMRSFVIPIVVMMAIPLTVLGIMPGFWLLNAISGGVVSGYADPIYFTATGMIGMIALSGIVTRDSIILVDFIHLSLSRGRSLFDAIMESRVVRLRPILLTSGTAMLSALPIALDPIFSGLAWALIFGLLASTVFTLFVIPVAYWLVYANKPGHGLPVVSDDA